MLERRTGRDLDGYLHSHRLDRLSGAATATATINVDKAAPTIQLSDSGAHRMRHPFPGHPDDHRPRSSRMASLEGVIPTLTYYEGPGTSGTNSYASPPTAVGTYTVVADFLALLITTPRSRAVIFTITVIRDDFAEVLSHLVRLRPGQVMPAANVSAVKSLRREPSLSSTTALPLAVVLLDGSDTASFTTSPLAVGSQSITATYSGDAGLRARSVGIGHRVGRPVGAPRSCWYRIRCLKKKKVTSEVPDRGDLNRRPQAGRADRHRDVSNC